MRKIIKEIRRLNNNKKFKLELTLAVILALVCSLAGASNILFVSNKLFPFTSDAMGHMAKVKYISECLAQGEIPSWFPYWYNGATATQYYVPLSYYIMVPIYWATNNIMLTFKINCISMIFVGGIGVWTFCYKKIGKWCGLVGIIAYCLQSFLSESLYGAGVLAQGPIFALMPWFLLLILNCAKKPTRPNFLVCVILETLLILSHAMHAFMVCICTMVVLVVFIPLKKVTIKNFIVAASTIGFAGVLTAFWSVVGVTGIENPGIPYLLPEASLFYTATLDWFKINSSAVFHYSIAVTIMSIIAIFIFAFASLKKYNNDNQQYYGLVALLLTIFTTIFSFGMHLPLYKYLPLATSLVPGRILSYTAVTGAISSAYVVFMLCNGKKFKVICRITAFVILIAIVISMNPYKTTFATTSSDTFHSMTQYMDTKNNAFDKGRYEWLGAVDCTETFFPLQYGFNTSDGWNIEGTPHNKTIWNYFVASSVGAYDYLVKHMAYWNVRYLLVHQIYSNISTTLKEDMGFEKYPINRDAYSLYVSHLPSSYFLKDKRNSIIIGEGSSLVTIAFPYLIQGKSTHITDYMVEDLSKYQLVYLYEMDVATEKDMAYMESLITQLVNKGVKVVIEPKINCNFDVFGVQVADEPLETKPKLQIEMGCPWALDKDVYLNNSKQISIVRSLYGLDKTYASFLQQEGAPIKNSVLGVKKVGNGEVIFVGARLGNYLESVYTNAWGKDMVNDKIIKDGKSAEAIYEKIFASLGVSKTYLPETFDVTSSNWDYQGGSFQYNNDNTQRITVSVTYAPRWTAKLDGKEIKVGECENLITLDLPAGNHKVELNYGVTIYGKIGYIISCFGLVFFILVIIFFNKIQELLNKLGKLVKHYLQY